MRTYIRHKRVREEMGTRDIKIYVPRWVDPFFWVQGSEPEKRVMAELVRRGIYFEHTPQSNNLGGLVDPTWEGDFIFPQFHIWMEVNGFYFHTLPGQPEADAFRYAAIEAQGWRVLVWWDYDILDHLATLMDTVPEFYWVDPDKNKGKTTDGLPFFEGGDGIDHLKGLRAALRNRARPPQFESKHRTQEERHAK